MARWSFASIEAPMTAPKKAPPWLVILTLIGLRIVPGSDPILTEPPKVVATTLATQITRDHWIIDTFAGGEIGDNGPAIQARLDSPRGVAVDGAGNLYIADSDNDRIRRVDPSGTITTVAGTGETGFSGDSGPAARARLNFPQGLAVDDTGNLFIADSGNHRIRRVDPSGIITTVAGRGERGFSGDGGPSIRAQFDYPLDVAVDSAGNLFIADYWNHRIRRVGPSGAISTIAGSSKQGFSGDGDPAVTAQLRGPAGVAVDGAGNLFIADSGNDRIRRVDPSGVITTIAGTGASGFSGDGDPAVTAQLRGPAGVAVDSAGSLFIADSGNDRIRRVDPSGVITTMAGMGAPGFGGDNGSAVDAQLFIPAGVAVDSAGNLFIADSGNDRIRRVDPSGTISTIAGTRQRRFSGDNGAATQARLHAPFGLATDNAGNLFIADYLNHRIRRVDPTGTISTIAGTGERGHSGDGGPAVAARLNFPDGLAVDSAGNLFIADSGNHSIRRVGPLGTITTIAGTGAWGFGGDNGPATQARLHAPSGLATDNTGNLFIADSGNDRIRRVDPSGTITTVAGTGETGFSGDGGPAVAARLNNPTGIAVDSASNLFIADSWNSRIRRVDPSGTITTVAGTGKVGFSGDGGPAVAARLGYPEGVALDGSGNLYVNDRLNQRIRRVDPSGTITTIAGTGKVGFSGDGGPAVQAQFDYPQDVAVDPLGNLYVADTDNNRIRILTRTTSPVTLPRPTGLTATAISSSRIDITWRDNSHNETGFRIGRRQNGSAEWVEVGTTAANVNTFSDAGLEPDTTYRYRVQAFNSAGGSAFSPESVAKTLKGTLIDPGWRIDTFAGGAIGDNGPAILAWAKLSLGPGGRWHRQPLHCRRFQSPHSPCGHLWDHHHHRRHGRGGLQRGRRSGGGCAVELTPRRGSGRLRQPLHRRLRQQPHSPCGRLRDHHHHRRHRRVGFGRGRRSGGGCPIVRSPRCGSGRRRQPLHRRLQQQPHSPRGRLRDHHHHRRHRRVGFGRGRRSSGRSAP